MGTNAVTVYRSKVDAWLVAVLVTSVIASMVGAMFVVPVRPPLTWALAALIAGVGVFLPLWLLNSTRYSLLAGELLIRCGPFRWRIPLAGITGITPTSNPVSSPALSLDRLRIDYGTGDSLMISPRDKAGFIRELEAARRRMR